MYDNLVILVVQRTSVFSLLTILKNQYIDMDKRLEEAFKNYNRILGQQKFIEADLDYSILEYHRPFLEKLDVIDSSTITIFDLYKREHIYISSNFESVLGYDIDQAHAEGTEYFNQFVHEEDFVLLTEAGVHFLEMSFNVPRDTIRDYKLLTEYRMKKANGDWIRVVEQHLCLELDKHGNVWLSLSMLDISPDQNLELPAQSRLLNFKTGKLYHLPVVPKNKDKKPLTKREKEILNLLATGLISKQIADRLYISTNTVNTHRQRIIEKLDVTNTTEAVNYSMSIGLL